MKDKKYWADRYVIFNRVQNKHPKWSNKLNERMVSSKKEIRL